MDDDEDLGRRATPALPEVPALTEPLDALDFPLATPGDADTPFVVRGRRATAHGTGAGLDELWAGPNRLLRGLRVGRERVAGLTVTALGVEREMVVDGVTVAERLVVSHDSPVAWLQWTASEPVTLELEWRVDLAAYTGAPEVDEARGELAWDAIERGVLATRKTSGSPGSPGSPGPYRAAFVFSRAPQALGVETGGGAGAAGAGRGGDADTHRGAEAGLSEAELTVRARVPLSGDAGVRLAVVGLGSDDDPARLLGVADRVRVGVRAREAIARRVLAEGLAVSAPDPAVADGLCRARLRLALTALPPSGPWRLHDLVADAYARLATGEFDAVRRLLRLLDRQAGDGGVPRRGVGPEVLPADQGDDSRAGELFRDLAAHYLAWSGDRATVGRLRSAPAVAADPSPAEVGGVIGRVVSELLGAEPDAPRGRLVLRPRPPTGWDRFDVRGLAVGDAAVSLGYHRDGGLHRFTVEQTRGAAPLQLVLQPELSSGREPSGGVEPSRRAAHRARVDGEAAELDIVPVGGRWRVPVQIVLDYPRTLEVEFADDSA